MISLAFLQHLRLTRAEARGENAIGARRPAAPPDAPGRAPRPRRPTPPRRATLPDVPRAPNLSAPRTIDLAK
jgi:hypothetical protein